MSHTLKISHRKMSPMNRSKLSLAVILLMVLAGCSSQGEPPIGTTNSSVQFEFPAVSGAASPTISKPVGAAPSELQIKDLVIGSGAPVGPSSTVQVNYVGVSWSTGEVFDSSFQRGTPAEFPLANVIQGWRDGLSGAKVGGRREIVIPPGLAYGPTGQGPIGPNETLVFVVDILGVK